MATSTAGVGALDQNQFLQLLVAQLQNQDPLDPINNQEFISQLATLNSVQGLQNLNASFSQMLKLQQLTQGSDLIGRTVEYTLTGDTASKTGTVASVETSNGNFVLQVGSDQVGLDQVSSVKN